MNKRPISITVFAWVFIVMGVFSLINIIPLLNNPNVIWLMSQNTIPISILYFNMCGGVLVYLVSGIWILKGQNWARFLYFIGNFIHLVINIATFPKGFETTIPTLVIFFIPLFFLFRPKANEYFKR
jgi:hypothetical protein